MNFIKRIFGFNSEVSWAKWLRISFAIAAIIIAGIFFGNFLELILDGGIIGGIIAIIIFLFFFGPAAGALLGGAAVIGTLVGGALSLKKQRQSFRDTAATGSAELMELEHLRMKAQVLDFLFALTPLVLGILYFVVAEDLYEMFDEPGLYAYMVLAGVILFGFWLAKLPVRQRYRDAFKEQVVIAGLESALDNMDFQPGAKLDEALVKASALFPDYDVYMGNDYLAADYRGRHFIQSDIRLQEEREESYRDSDGDWQTRTVYVTIFSGRLVVFDYDAISNEPVAVYDRHGGKPKQSEAIQTELDAFNRRFFVVASSPAAAFRILTPPVLEGIVLASGKLGCPMSLSFRDDKLYVALYCGDSFEASSGDTTLSEQRQRISKEIRAMLDLVDILYLK